MTSPASPSSLATTPTSPTGQTRSKKTVAFFLPQFHPIPENDDAWGPGFTEWHNVVRGAPRFRGHAQPKLPADLGFYDLRLEETRLAQQHLARQYAVDAFCWYHYWFSGTRLLNEPLDRMLANRAEDLPFCLCWANESWTRNWSGHSGSVIVQQRYSPEDDIAHIRWLTPILADHRYLREEGRAVFLVYQPTELPEPQRTFERWRTEAASAGVGELLLLGVASFRNRLTHPERLGLDGVVVQQPNLRLVRPAWKAAPRWTASRLGLVDRSPRLSRYPYRRLRDKALDGMMSSQASVPLFPTVTPGWDNTPRRGRGAVVITGASPKLYEEWLYATLEQSTAPLIFVNAWNEWGEGAHLEPDSVNGSGYLQAHRNAVQRARQPASSIRNG